MEPDLGYDEQTNQLVQATYNAYADIVGASEEMLRKMVMAVRTGMEKSGWIVVPPGTERNAAHDIVESHYV